MNARRGPITLFFRKSVASLAIAGGVFVAAALFNIAMLSIIDGGLVGVPSQVWSGFGAIPKPLFGLGCLLAFLAGVILLELAALAWVFRWLAPSQPPDPSPDSCIHSD